MSVAVRGDNSSAPSATSPDGVTFPLGVATAPLPTGATPFSAQTSTTNAVSSAFIPALAGRTAYLTGLVAGGLGATAAALVLVSVFNIVGGTYAMPFAVPAGVGVAAYPLSVVFIPALVATGPNIPIQVNLAAFGSGNVGQGIGITGYYI